MNIYNKKRKRLVPGPNSWYAKANIWLKERIGTLIYEFNSVEEFEEAALNGKIKNSAFSWNKSIVELFYVPVHTIVKGKDDIVVIFCEESPNVVLNYRTPTSIFGTDEETWSILEGLKSGDKTLVRFYYNSYGWYNPINAKMSQKEKTANGNFNTLERLVD